ncbi:MAG: hypothetical protein H8E15_04220 [Planctomycetes bacterium]|nr:hypothetical protein [Planctomycetota bacterium]
MSGKSSKNSSTKKHICIDFEGEGRKKNKYLPQPALLGAFVPNLNGRGKKYFLWLLKPELAPMERSPWLPGNAKLRKVCSFEEAIQDVIDLSLERDCRLISYSIHEKSMVKEQLGERNSTRHGFSERYFNIKPKAQALRNRRKFEAPDHSLDSLLKALAPKNKYPPAPKGGAAVACRRLQRAGQESRWWRKWAESEREIAKDLLLYNIGDCQAVWRLTNRVMANYNLPELR